MPAEYEAIDIAKHLKTEFLKRVSKAWDRADLTELKRVSDKAVEEAIFTEDRELIDISLIAYALNKLLSKPHFMKEKKWKAFVANVASDLRECLEMVEAGKELSGILEKDIIEDITELDVEFGNYARDVIAKARLKQASTIYALGMSIDKALALTGADRFELMQYIGRTKIHDRPYTTTLSVKQRYKMAKEVLG